MSRARQPRSRRRKWAVWLLLSVGVSVLGILAGETGARVYASATKRERGMDYSATLGWHILPNIEKVGDLWCADVPARSNSHGWRDAEHSYQRVPGMTRILALGDSFTFGHGVDYGDRFTELLERDLEHTEVINLGACAFGTDQELLAWESEGYRYQPDVVLLSVYVGNDLDDIRMEKASGWSKPYFRFEADELELVQPTLSLATRVRTKSYLAEVLLQYIGRNQPSRRRAAEWETGTTLPLFGALIRRLHAGVESSGARLIVVVIHEAGDGRSRRSNELLAELDACGVDVLDTQEAFEASDLSASELYHADGFHWRPEGHALAARLIAEELRR